ncbi:hypothetical protein GA0115240_14332 [Streptomyces sp. DvalAA-14]|uniref:hypothetical protein n=1 Tax=unclassified Streptomyces TaxID=2593676 RepID=UPI00081BA308|nr:MULTISPECIES: hypothetical protein [unclassified Streptomyces]MYS22677.1 hypothetical protein [Streptomyces sp. SID4948]SCE20443.1 hypothetical protein GA0115240_14332 [Streptomyces sp. DvalAA-14]
MGRRMRPLDPVDGPVERFASELRALRALAGDQPFWKMARRCSVGKSALASAAAGRELPSLNVTREFVRACDGEWSWWRARWSQTAAELETASQAASQGASRAPGAASAALVRMRPGVVDLLGGRPPSTAAGEGAAPIGQDPARGAEPRRARRGWRLVAAAVLVGAVLGSSLTWRIGFPGARSRTCRLPCPAAAP